MENVKSKKRKWFSWGIAIVAAFVIVLVAVDQRKGLVYLVRGEDRPPEVNFTWTPIGRVKLKEMVGTVTIEDDYAIDFSTLKLQIVELKKTIKIARDDLVGRNYSERVSFLMLSGNAEIESRGEMTVRISVADDKGQLTEIERVVKIEPEILTTDSAVLRYE